MCTLIYANVFTIIFTLKIVIMGKKKDNNADIANIIIKQYEERDKKKKRKSFVHAGLAVLAKEAVKHGADPNTVYKKHVGFYKKHGLEPLTPAQLGFRMDSTKPNASSDVDNNPMIVVDTEKMPTANAVCDVLSVAHHLINKGGNVSQLCMVADEKAKEKGHDCNGSLAAVSQGQDYKQNVVFAPMKINTEDTSLPSLMGPITQGLQEMKSITGDTTEHNSEITPVDKNDSELLPTPNPNSIYMHSNAGIVADTSLFKYSPMDPVKKKALVSYPVGTGLMHNYFNGDGQLVGVVDEHEQAVGGAGGGLSKIFDKVTSVVDSVAKVASIAGIFL